MIARYFNLIAAGLLIASAGPLSAADKSLEAHNALKSWKTFFKRSWEFYREKKFSQGLTAVRDAEALFDEESERSPSDLAELLNLESLILRSMGDFQEASQVCERLTKIDQKRFKEPNSALAVDYECLGETYEKTDRRELAYKAYKKALAIREKLIQTDDAALRRLRRIVARLAPPKDNKNEEDSASVEKDSEPTKPVKLDDGLLKKIKQICSSIDQSVLAAKLQVASAEIGSYALRGEAGQFFPESVVVGTIEANLFSTEPFVELACHGESRVHCSQYRDDLDQRVRRIILLRAVLGAEKWQKERLYDPNFLMLTDFGNLVYPPVRDHCVTSKK